MSNLENNSSSFKEFEDLKTLISNPNVNFSEVKEAIENFDLKNVTIDRLPRSGLRDLLAKAEIPAFRFKELATLALPRSMILHLIRNPLAPEEFLELYINHEVPIFLGEVAAHRNISTDQLLRLIKTPKQFSSVLIAGASNSVLTSDIVQQENLMASKNKYLRLGLAKNKNLSKNYLKRLSKSKNTDIREAVLLNSNSNLVWFSDYELQPVISGDFWAKPKDLSIHFTGLELQVYENLRRNFSGTIGELLKLIKA